MLDLLAPSNSFPVLKWTSLLATRSEHIHFRNQEFTIEAMKTNTAQRSNVVVSPMSPKHVDIQTLSFCLFARRKASFSMSFHFSAKMDPIRKQRWANRLFEPRNHRFTHPWASKGFVFDEFSFLSENGSDSEAIVNRLFELRNDRFNYP